MKASILFDLSERKKGRKHDKEWIESNSPESKVGRNCKVKKYSLDEDIAFLRKAEKLIWEWSDYEKLKSV